MVSMAALLDALDDRDAFFFAGTTEVRTFRHNPWTFPSTAPGNSSFHTKMNYLPGVYTLYLAWQAKSRGRYVFFVS